jgi:hypothetical protein
MLMVSARLDDAPAREKFTVKIRETAVWQKLAKILPELAAAFLFLGKTQHFGLIFF